MRTCSRRGFWHAWRLPAGPPWRIAVLLLIVVLPLAFGLGAGSAESTLPPGVEPDHLNEFGEFFTVIGSFEGDEQWVGGSANPSLRRHQGQAWTLTSTNGADSMTTRVFDPPLDLTMFESSGTASDENDYIDLWGYQHDTNLQAGSIHLDASPPGQEWTDYFSYYTLGVNEAGWRYLHVPKGLDPNLNDNKVEAWMKTGDPSWSSIVRARISIRSLPQTTSSFTFDLWRMVSADTAFVPREPRHGVNVRCDQDGVDPDAIVAKAKELGAEWVRLPFRWNEIEKEGPGEFAYKDCYEDVVEQADDEGLTVLAVLFGTPEWARKESCKALGEHCPPADPNSIKPLIADMKAEFGDGIRYWEIWNEPNSPGFFHGEDASEYVPLLRAAYEEIQSIDPSDTVILGGIYDDGEMPIAWMDQFYAAGGGAYAEVMAFHPYTSQNDPKAAVVMSPWNYRGHTRAMRAIMAVYGDTPLDTDLWATEFGFSTSDSPWCDGQKRPCTDSEQGQLTVDAYDIAENSALIQGFFVYELVNQQPEGETPRSHEGNFGLLKYTTTSLPKKASFGIVKNRFLP